MEVRKLIEKMTGVCPVPLLSPAQFTEAACQFRYAPYTQNAYIYCMYACPHVDFLSMCESGRCTAFSDRNPSHRSLTLFLSFIFSHAHSEPIEPSARHQIEGEKAVANVLRYFFGILKLRTLCSVCGSLMHSHS